MALSSHWSTWSLPVHTFWVLSILLLIAVLHSKIPAMADDTGKLIQVLMDADNSKSLLKKYLTPDVAAKIKERKTTQGGTLGDCIRSGTENLDSGTGIYASDPDAYTTFRELFDNIIRDYHKVPSQQEIQHPPSDFGDLENLDFGDLDPDNKYIKSTRVRVGRSIQGFGFPPIISDEDRLKLESQVKTALQGLQGELKGTYHPLTGMTEETRKKLVEDHFLFNDHDRFLRSAGGYRNWPSGRGIYFNDKKTFLVWINEEDHMRIISMQMGGNLAAVYKRLVTAIQSIENSVPFARDERLGYLTFCPTNLGTTLRASVHIQIPKVAALKEFESICKQLNIQARGIHGEHTESVGGVYDISNKRRLGLTEYEAVLEMARGVSVLILLEKSLAAV